VIKTKSIKTKANMIYLIDDQSNIISVYGANPIDVEFDNCYFSLSRLISFADFVDNNAQRFRHIKIINSNDLIIDTENIRQLNNVSYRQYMGTLEIYDNRFSLATETDYLAIASIIQLFRGVRSLRLILPPVKEHIDSDCHLIESMQYCANFESLSNLSLYNSGIVNNTSMSSTNLIYVNKIVQKCPNIREVTLTSIGTINKPIDLPLLLIENEINITIINVI